jgi:hypothetical protein
MTVLKHIGILGMKWGRRKAKVSGPSSSDHKTSRSLKTKKLNELSNDELKKLTTRLQLEKQYKDLTKVELTGGKKIAAELLQGAGKQLASKYIANAAESGIKLVTDLLKKR